MAERVELTILVDNTALLPGLTAEHGLSMWLHIDNKYILFDTGAGIALPENATALGIDLDQTDAIVLSHGHHDHTRGLTHILTTTATPTLFMHPNATNRRYGCLQTPPHRPNGMPPEIVTQLSEKGLNTIPTTKPTQISQHLWVTGPIPRHTTFEDTGDSFFTDEACQVADPITDDQALWLETRDGIVLLLGCAHAGIVNTLDYIAELTHTTQFLAVIGGMHLLNASPVRIKATIDALKRHQIKQIAPCHCTGETVIPLLAQQFPEHYLPIGAGSHFTWPVCQK